MNKKTLARKLMTRIEIKAHISPFLSKAWTKRKEEIAARVERKKLKRNEKQEIHGLG